MSTTDQDLRKTFHKYGDIVDIKIKKGYGFVEIIADNTI